MFNYRNLNFIISICISYFPLAFAEFIHITSPEQYQKTVLENSNPVLVEFAADWCSVCKGIEKPFETIAQEPEFHKKVTFARINIDSMNTISQKHSIVGVPTFVYMHQGKKINEEIGINNLNTFQDSLRANIRQNFQLAQANQNQDTTIQASSEKPSRSVQQSTLPTAQPEGFIEKILAFIMQLLMQIKELFMRLFTSIKNLFGM